jgi:enoyl-CoA hydratase/carnithine racemase
LSRRAGIGRALDLCISGRWIDARESLLIGLFDKLVARRQLLRSAEQIASALATAPRELAAMIKTAVHDGLEMTLREGLALERRLAAIRQATEAN